MSHSLAHGLETLESMLFTKFGDTMYGTLKILYVG